MSLTVEQEVRHLVSAEIANHYKVLPYRVHENILTLYVDESNCSEEIKDEIEMLTGHKINFIPTSNVDVQKALSLYYRKDREFAVVKPFSLSESDFLESLIYEARNLKSSDIHCEVYEDDARIRFRIDGQLIERFRVEHDNYLELVNKIKIKSKLNITEKRLPQDGRITTPEFDIRVSILPTLFGEKIVMRLLGQDASNISLNSLGLKDEEQYHYLEAVRKPNGIILISGPTGSGKTTTLYATLKLLNDDKRNIVTVEDPIEYTLKGINQVQLKEDIGLTFSTALKSFLRQDPDIIMLGEIRDPETALMAIRASLTGHLVLSTIHTNSAVGTISRLIDMGVPSYLIAETLNLSVAQRLIRKLCQLCKMPVSFSETDFPKSFDIPYTTDQIFKPVGCNNCFHTGYKGRIAIYELFSISYDTAVMIKNNETEKLTETVNYKTLSEQAYDLLTSGETSLEEIYSILINI